MPEIPTWYWSVRSKGDRDLPQLRSARTSYSEQDNQEIYQTYAAVFRDHLTHHISPPHDPLFLFLCRDITCYQRATVRGESYKSR